MKEKSAKAFGAPSRGLKTSIHATFFKILGKIWGIPAAWPLPHYWARPTIALSAETCPIGAFIWRLGSWGTHFQWMHQCRPFLASLDISSGGGLNAVQRQNT